MHNENMKLFSINVLQFHLLNLIFTGYINSPPYSVSKTTFLKCSECRQIFKNYFALQYEYVSLLSKHHAMKTSGTESTFSVF